MDLVDLLEVRRQGLVLNTEAKVAPYGDTVLAAHGDDRGSVVRGDLPVSHERGGRERRSQRQDYYETIGRTLIDPEPPQTQRRKRKIARSQPCLTRVWADPVRDHDGVAPRSKAARYFKAK